MALGGGASRALVVENHQGLSPGAPWDWGNRDATVGRRTQGSTCTRSQDNTGTPEEAGSDLPVGLGGILERKKLAVAHWWVELGLVSLVGRALSGGVGLEAAVCLGGL